VYSKEELVKPFYFSGGEHGLLLIHGFTACPIDLKPLAEILHGFGYTILAPLLAGHGTTPEQMKETSYQDWLNSAKEALALLRKECRQVTAVGHSFGGLLGLMLAVEQQVDRVVSINAPIVLQNKDIARADEYLGKIEYVDKNYKKDQTEITVTAEGLPHFSYTRVPIKCLVEMNRAIAEMENRLPEIKCPALIIQGDRDETVDPVSAQIIAEKLGSSWKKLSSWANEGHYLPLSAKRAELAKEIHNFCKPNPLPGASIKCNILL